MPAQAENNVAINEEQRVNEKRAKAWIRIERYWEGEYPNARARFLPVMCQHCATAPCEPVCPVWATYHNEEGLNVQVYNRCIGTRFCGQWLPIFGAAPLISGIQNGRRSWKTSSIPM